MGANAWPELTFESWAPTKRSLHLYAQMLGKLRLALSPQQPNFVFTALALTPRGFTTGLIPYGSLGLAVSVDVFTAEMIVEVRDGGARRIGLAEPCTVARVFADLERTLADLGMVVEISPIPQEVADQTPFDADERPAHFDSLAAQRWLGVATAINAVFDAWRSHFAGRMGVYLWWGAFDLAVLLFSGKQVPPPTDRGYLLRYDLDMEMMNAGFYPGDETNPPTFYGYIYPQPSGCSTLPIAPDGAAWSDAAREWILPYERVRASADPAATLAAFLDAIYRSCTAAAGWKSEAFSYVRPPLRRAPESPRAR
jgi:hypothetical protein